MGERSRRRASLTRACTTSKRPKAGGRVDKTKLTQVGRALQQLGVTHIPSCSPDARGRMERVFGTLQSRLPPELRLAKMTTVEAATSRCTFKWSDGLLALQ